MIPYFLTIEIFFNHFHSFNKFNLYINYIDILIAFYIMNLNKDKSSKNDSIIKLIIINLSAIRFHNKI